MNDLDRLFAVLGLAQTEYPKLTITGLRTLLFIAAETAERDLDRIPTVKKVANKLDMTISGAGRLLDLLSKKGRVRGGEANEGLGLIESDDSRRAVVYFLTEQGDSLVKQLLEKQTGENADWFHPLSLNAFQGRIK